MSFIQSGRSKIFYINSRNRLTGTDSDFTYKIEYDKELKFDSVCCLAAIIPTSYYLIRTNYNTFVLTEDAKTATITVPIGNYSRTTLKNTLTNLLNTYSPNGYTYAITTPTTSTAENGKYVFSVSGNGGIQPSFTLEDGKSNSLFEPMGFNYGVNSFVGDSLTSTNVTKLIAEDSIYIHSDICSNGDDNILQEIYSQDTAYFSTVIYKNQSPDAYSKLLTSNTTNVYRFYLTNEDDEELDLNGVNWNLTILLYKRNNIDMVQKKFMDYMTSKIERLK